MRTDEYENVAEAQAVVEKKSGDDREPWRQLPEHLPVQAAIWPDQPLSATDSEHAHWLDLDLHVMVVGAVVGGLCIILPNVQGPFDWIIGATVLIFGFPMVLMKCFDKRSLGDRFAPYLITNTLMLIILAALVAVIRIALL